MGVGGQHHTLAALPSGKTRYPLYRRQGGPQGWYGWVQKISPPTRIRSPDRPAFSLSLYQLSCHGPQSCCCKECIIISLEPCRTNNTFPVKQKYYNFFIMTKYIRWLLRLVWASCMFIQQGSLRNTTFLEKHVKHRGSALCVKSNRRSPSRYYWRKCYDSETYWILLEKVLWQWDILDITGESYDSEAYWIIMEKVLWQWDVLDITGKSVMTVRRTGYY